MAHSELIVLAFERTENAHHARRALELMRDRHRFGLEHAAEITCDHTGYAALHHHRPLSPSAPGAHPHLPPALFARIFARGVDDHDQRLAQAGLDDFFLQAVMQALTPNSSALLFYVPGNGSADTQALLNALALFDGTLHHTTLTREAECVLVSYERPDC